MAWKNNKLARVRSVLVNQLPVHADHHEGGRDAKGRTAAQAAELLRQKNEQMASHAMRSS